MMVARGARAFDSSGAVVVTCLTLLYGLMALYGALAVVVGVPTIAAVAGDAFELAWPVGICLGAMVACLSLQVSWRTGKLGFEMVATALLVMWLFIYAIALVLRGILGPHPSDLASWVLPVGFAAVPAVRVLVVHIRRGSAAARQ